MKIAIVLTPKTGHHLEYIYAVSKYLSHKDTGFKFDIYCNGEIWSYIKKNDLEEIGNSKEVNIINNLLDNPSSNNWLVKTYYTLKNIIYLKKYDRVIFLSLNSYFISLVLYSFFSSKKISFSGIYLDPFIRHKNKYKNLIRYYVIKLILDKYPNSNFFILNDKYAVKKLNKVFSTLNFNLLNDPVPKYYYNKVDSYNNCSRKSIYLLIGSIQKRKGVLEFLDAIEIAEGKNKFIIAGKVESAILSEVTKRVKLLDSKGKDIELYNKFISNREFAEFVLESDVLVLPYLNKGASSGILGHAAFMNKKVIGPEEGLISSLIKEYEMGATVDPTNQGSFAKLLSANPYEIIESNRKRMNDYVSENSIENFVNKIIQSVV